MPESKRLKKFAFFCAWLMPMTGAQELFASESIMQGDQLTEIIVTAQKREERLVDVPSSIAVIDGAQLDRLNIASLSDLASYVPGLTINSFGSPGSRQITIRGLQTNFNNEISAATVGAEVDDMPVGSSTGAGPGASGIDLAPYDIESIEILKGPQGTLYGSSTLGGLIKYKLRQPSLHGVDVQSGASAESTENGGTSWTAHAEISAPIIDDVLGIRISGYYKNNAGYLNNVTLGIADANSSSQKGDSISVLWKPTDRFSLRALALEQIIDAADLSVENVDAVTKRPAYGAQNFSAEFRQPFFQPTHLYHITAEWDLGFGTITSSTGYSGISFKSQWDLSHTFGPFCAPNLFPGYAGCVDYPFGTALALFQFGAPKSEKMIEEVRIASRADYRFSWMIGGFFNHEISKNAYQSLPTASSPGGALLPERDNLFHIESDSSYLERAGFANARFRVTNQLDFGGGVRYTAYSATGSNPLNAGLLVGAAYSSPVSIEPPVGVTTWMADSRFHFTTDSMLYASVSTGYRAGSGCKFRSDGTSCSTTLATGLVIPGEIRPDSTKNYEVGYKAELFDHRLSINADAFLIDWKDIQLNVIVDSLNIAGNGGTARSDGFEFAAQYLVVEGLRINESITFTNAYLTQDAPAVNGYAGNQLPTASRWAAATTVDYEKPLGANNTLLAGAAYRYRDAIVSQFAGNTYSYPIGPQNIIDAYAGIRKASTTVRVYARNAFNNRSYAGLMYVDNPTTPAFIPIQPRTIGVSVNCAF